MKFTIFKLLRKERYRMQVRFFLPILLLLSVVACTPLVEKKCSTVVVPKFFSQKGKSVLPSRWWVSFRDRQLDTLIDEALRDNFSLLAAWDRLGQAQAIAMKAGASRYPDLNVVGAVSQQEKEVSGKSSDTESYIAGLVVSYELDFWGRITSSRDAAELEATATEYDLQAAAITLSSQVAVTWYNLVEKYSQDELLTRQIATNQKALEIITLQVRTGKVGTADMLQQQQLIETKLGERARLKAQTHVLENQLAVLLGRPPAGKFEFRSTSFVELPPRPDVGLPIELLQKRPDVRSSYMLVQAADKRVAAAIADTYPRISLTGRLETSGAKSRDLFNNWLVSLAANLTAPIVDGGLRQAEVERVQSVASEKVHLYGQVVLGALSEVEDGLAQESQQLLYLESLRRQLSLASQAIERIREKYIQGGVDYQRVLTALLSQQQIEKTLLSAQRDLLINRISLCRALGGGWELHSPLQDESNNEIVD